MDQPDTKTLGSLTINGEGCNTRTLSEIFQSATGTHIPKSLGETIGNRIVSTLFNRGGTTSYFDQVVNVIKREMERTIGENNILEYQDILEPAIFRHYTLQPYSPKIGPFSLGALDNLLGFINLIDQERATNFSIQTTRAELTESAIIELNNLYLFSYELHEILKSIENKESKKPNIDRICLRIKLLTLSAEALLEKIKQTEEEIINQLEKETINQLDEDIINQLEEEAVLIKKGLDNLRSKFC